MNLDAVNLCLCILHKRGFKTDPQKDASCSSEILNVEHWKQACVLDNETHTRKREIWGCRDSRGKALRRLKVEASLNCYKVM
ncbi:hypothetical protein Bca4012_037506 [Brassica carinata]